MTFVVLDLMMLNLFYLVCHSLLSKHIDPGSRTTYLIYWVINNALWLTLSFFLRGYATNVILNFEAFIKRTIQVYLIWIIFIMFYLFFFREIVLSRLFIIATLISLGLALMLNRFIYLGINKYFTKSKFIVKKVLILGYNDTAKKLAKYFEEDGMNTKIMGYVEDKLNVHELSHYPVISEVSRTLDVAKNMGVQEIYSTITPEQDKNIYNLMYQAENECIRFKIVPNLSVFITRDVHIEYFGELPVISLRTEPLDDVGNRIKKRVLDIVISSLVILLVLSWLIPLIGLLIVFESRGPIFFKQLRTGKNKQPFNCIKFRSMRPNKEADLRQATQHDMRVTKIGKFLRKTSLDEFPQFLNVFLGEMSLVGPRPHMLKHTSDYSEVVEEYMVRQFIKPGITGWAQIHGFRGEITNEEQIRMRVDKDLWYLENWTLWLDIQILFLTIYTIVKGDKNAY